MHTGTLAALISSAPTNPRPHPCVFSASQTAHLVWGGKLQLQILLQFCGLTPKLILKIRDVATISLEFGSASLQPSK